MAPSVSLSTRVPRDLHERLAAEARARHVHLGTLARELLAAGVDAEHRPAGDGGLANEVECLFHNLPPDTGVQREVCLALSRAVEAGGAGAVSAAKELVGLTDMVRLRYGLDFEDEDQDEDEDAGKDGAEEMMAVGA